MDFLLILQIFLLFILPILVIKYNLIPIKYRLYFLFLIPIILIGDIIHSNWTLNQLGIRIDNLNSSFMPFIILTLMAAFLLLIFSKVLGRELDKDILKKDSHFIYLLFIPISIIQQFIFQGYLLNKLLINEIDPLFSIILTALLFSFMHIIYPNALLHVPLAFFGGILFAQTYYYYPNLFLASLMHLVLNPIAVLHGFFVPLKHHKDVYKDLINLKILKKHIKKNLLLIKVYLFIIIFIGSYFIYREYFNLEIINENLEFIKSFIVENPIISPIIFIIICVLLINSPLSVTAILKLIGGFFFGFYFGFIYSLIGFFLGCSIGYIITKYLLHEYLEDKHGKSLNILNDEVRNNGFYYFLTLRMILIIPHYIINILGGLSKIKTRSFLSSTFLGLIPETLIYVYLGSLLSNLTSFKEVFSLNIILLLIIIAILSLIPSILKLCNFKKHNI